VRTVTFVVCVVECFFGGIWPLLESHLPWCRTYLQWLVFLLPQDLPLWRRWREPSDYPLPLHRKPPLRAPVLPAAVDKELRHPLLRALQIRVHHGDQAEAFEEGAWGGSPTGVSLSDHSHLPVLVSLKRGIGAYVCIVDHCLWCWGLSPSPQEDIPCHSQCFSFLHTETACFSCQSSGP
jgi:hypothetical protein